MKKFSNDRLIHKRRIDASSLISRLKEHGKTTVDLVGNQKPGSISEF